MNFMAQFIISRTAVNQTEIHVDNHYEIHMKKSHDGIPVKPEVHVSNLSSCRETIYKSLIIYKVPKINLHMEIHMDITM